MGVDVFKSFHTELGILDTGMYDHDLVYGVSPGAFGDKTTRDGVLFFAVGGWCMRRKINAVVYRRKAPP